MGYKINRIQNNLNKNVSEAMSKLSTGLRINKASNDSAGLSVSTRIEAFTRANKVGIQNVQQSVSLLNTIEGGLSSIESMVQRLREITLQVQNGTLSSTDRTAVQKEADQIIAGIENTAKKSTYNDMKVLNNSLLKFDGVNDYVNFGLSYEGVMTQNHTLEATFIPEIPAKTEFVFGVQGWHHNFGLRPNKSITFETWFRDSAGTGKSLTIATPANFFVPGDKYQVQGIVDKDNRMMRFFVNGKEIGSGIVFPSGYTLFDYGTSTGGSVKMGMGNDTGSLYDYPFSGTIESARIYTKALSDNDIQSNNSGAIKQVDLVGEWLASDGADGVQYGSVPGSPTGIVSGASRIYEEIKVRSGASEEDVMKMELVNVSSKALGLYGLNITDPTAIKKIDTALDNILIQHSRVGSTINRLSFKGERLHIADQTSSQALSRIVDTDIGEETSHLIKEQLKIQSSMSMLQKNNLNRESLLSLIKG